MTKSNSVNRVLMPIAQFLALVAGYGLLGLALLVTVEILLRRFMNFSLQGGNELGGYVLAILAAFGFSFALLERAHTRVEILIELVPGRLQAWLNLISAWCIALMAAFMAWRAAGALLESIEFGSLSGTPLMTPLWQPQSLWVVGLTFFAVTSLAIAVHSTALLVRDPRELNRLYGTKTLEEVLEEETVSTLEARGATAQ